MKHVLACMVFVLLSTAAFSAAYAESNVEIHVTNANYCHDGNSENPVNWVVDMTNHGPDETSIGAIAFYDTNAGCDPTVRFAAGGLDMSGQYNYPAGSSGQAVFTFDSRHYNCGRVQVDAFYRTSDGGRTVFIGDIINYGVDCPPEPAPYCGDSIVQSPEQCDDGNANNNDACTNSCLLTICGDGVIQNPNSNGQNEQCDDANSNNNDACTNTCLKTICGDGTIQTPNSNGQMETCDDGNTNNNDGCSNVCKIEVCGDGIKQNNEQCDDGNTNNGDGCSSVCTIEIMPGSISGMKFNDLNGDGIKQGNEQGLAGWTIFLDANGNGVIDAGETTTTTGLSGTYSFTVSPGIYRVREVQQSDWTQTTTNPGPITITSGTHVNNIDFGNQAIVSVNSISGLKFNDLNGNGIQDTGEPILSGWLITLNGPVDASSVTDASGIYEFTGLPDGTYTVCETMQTGWHQTSPSSGPSCPGTTKGHSVTVSNSSSSGNNNFGNTRLPGSISGVKFKDLNGNGVRDDNDPGMFGWTIFLDANGNGLIDAGEANTSTGSQGEFSFTNLQAGTYVVREVQQEGWTQTTPNPAPIVINGNNVTGIYFGNSPAPILLNSISGMKFNDANGNGVRDENETGLANWTIKLDGNNLSTTTITDENGDYEFTGLPDGTYVICEVQKSGWTQTYPVSGASCTDGKGHTMSLSDGAGSVNNNFGNMIIHSQSPGNISGMKFKDLNGNGVRDVNDPGMFGWVIFLDMNNNSLLDVDESNVSTGAQGEFSFSNIPAGIYLVREVQQEGWTQTTVPMIVEIDGNDVTNVNIGNHPDIIPLPTIANTNGGSRSSRTVSGPLNNISQKCAGGDCQPAAPTIPICQGGLNSSLGTCLAISFVSVEGVLQCKVEKISSTDGTIDDSMKNNVSCGPRKWSVAYWEPLGYWIEIDPAGLYSPSTMC